MECGRGWGVGRTAQTLANLRGREGVPALDTFLYVLYVAQQAAGLRRERRERQTLFILIKANFTLLFHLLCYCMSLQ